MGNKRQRQQTKRKRKLVRKSHRPDAPSWRANPRPGDPAYDAWSAIVEKHWEAIVQTYGEGTHRTDDPIVVVLDTDGDRVARDFAAAYGLPTHGFIICESNRQELADGQDKQRGVTGEGWWPQAVTDAIRALPQGDLHVLVLTNGSATVGTPAHVRVPVAKPKPGEKPN